MDSLVDFPCPICAVEGDLFMRAHTSEIPYFGEHTQVTLLCNKCGWRQTDFIPSEGSKAGGWSICVQSEDVLNARVVRSSSCTPGVQAPCSHENEQCRAAGQSILEENLESAGCVS